jgi:hypothetical protein
VGTKRGWLVVVLCITPVLGQSHAQNATPEFKAEHSSHIYEHPNDVIEPGVGFGGLKIGESRERALKLFPFKPHVDQEWKDECGDMFNWVEDSSPGGNVVFTFEKGQISQIESATTRFHTTEGVTTYDSPEEVQRQYKGLPAYLLVGITSVALGDRPLVFWVDQDKGIAFELAYSPEERRRYLYEIIVFRPHANLCPEGKTTTPENWRELPPYSLEPPDRKALHSVG